ncbi:hypothetical protein GLYMA_14G034500v4 [Glycine max]|uniref:Uncharacterized protein n=1 Tax=Glycine max TaxID=3847 RepID=K7M4R0_SOYBN|nr:hypothetical protein JHK85_039464 [Glycine max]KAG5120768.1 hypothetical protein JHK84_039108 [Glycine max]KAH1092932.1 hypothetical protein GYH30_038917 [Glycine max]KRH14575.1 hypothetical protein GLYMA_14G034500v4 [Glycine max]
MPAVDGMLSVILDTGITTACYLVLMSYHGLSWIVGFNSSETKLCNCIQWLRL